MDLLWLLIAYVLRTRHCLDLYFANLLLCGGTFNWFIIWFIQNFAENQDIYDSTSTSTTFTWIKIDISLSIDRCWLLRTVNTCVFSVVRVLIGNFYCSRRRSIQRLSFIYLFRRVAKNQRKMYSYSTFRETMCASFYYFCVLFNCFFPH